jgi:hypothetical protein
MIDVQVAAWMLLLYRWRFFGCEKLCGVVEEELGAEWSRVILGMPG